MKSKALLAAILFPLLFLSCTPKKSKEELAHLDPSSPENFIQSVIDNRKDTYSDTGAYNIAGNSVFSKGNFHILNFTEQIGTESYHYSILLNPDKTIQIDSTEKSIYAGVQSLLRKQTGLLSGMIKGNVDLSKDFLGDGSPDFVLEQTSGKGNNTQRDQTILLYNGQNQLTPTDIRASTLYKPGRNEADFTGVKEIFDFKPGEPVTILVHHLEDSAGLKKIRYDKTWRWSNTDSTWQTGLIATELDNPGFEK